MAPHASDRPARLQHRRTRAGVFALGLALAATAHAAPVALVTDVVGAGTARGAPLRLLAALDAGSELTVPEGGRVVVFYVGDGSEWTLPGSGRFRLGPRAPQPLERAPAPQRTQAPPALAAVKLRGANAVQGGVQMRGGAAEPPTLVAPVDEAVLAGDVAFAWSAAGAGTTYRFELVDAVGAKVYVTDTVTPAVRLPSGIALAPGATYTWAVSGRDPNATQPFYRAAAFRVVDAATGARLVAAKPSADAPFATRALYVAVLQDAGARSAARAEQEAIAAQRDARWAPLR